MRLVDRQGRPTTLFVSTLSPSTGKPTVTLRVDKPDAYSICSVKVIRAPKDLHYLGRTFVNLAEAVGDLKQAGCIPDRTSGSLFYLNDFNPTSSAVPQWDSVSRERRRGAEAHSYGGLVRSRFGEAVSTSRRTNFRAQFDDLL